MAKKVFPKIVTDLKGLRDALSYVFDDTAHLQITYSEDVESGSVEVDYDKKDKVVYIVGSADGVGVTTLPYRHRGLRFGDTTGDVSWA